MTMDNQNTYQCKRNERQSRQIENEFKVSVGAGSQLEASLTVSESFKRSGGGSKGPH